MRFMRFFSIFENERVIIAEIPIIVKNPETIYIEKHTARFLKTFESSLHQGDDKTIAINYNSNIEPIFYNHTNFDKAIACLNNNIESIWRSRILIENTPRGNVLMFFDAFKSGFVYYSDQSGIPYKIINAVIMKYVIMYRCRDFFIDNYDTSCDYISPFLAMRFEENNNEILKKRKVMNGIQKNNEKLPFVKSKPTINSNSSVLSVPVISQDERVFVKNKVIYLGKLVNMNLLNVETVTDTINDYDDYFVDDVMTNEENKYNMNDLFSNDFDYSTKNLLTNKESGTKTKIKNISYNDYKKIKI